MAQDVYLLQSSLKEADVREVSVPIMIWLLGYLPPSSTTSAWFLDEKSDALFSVICEEFQRFNTGFPDPLQVPFERILFLTLHIFAVSSLGVKAMPQILNGCDLVSCVTAEKAPDRKAEAGAGAQKGHPDDIKRQEHV